MLYMLELLSEMSNENILSILKPSTAKFVVYLHKDMQPITFGWRSNTRALSEDDSIIIVDYAETVQEATSKVAIFEYKK